MDREQADLAYPLVTDERGRVGWLPGLTPRLPGVSDTFDGTPEEFRTRFGDEARDFTWAQGICLLVVRDAIERRGPHRDDFWVRGEDLEFSLRLTRAGAWNHGPHGGGATLCPPPETSGPLSEAEYLKHCALVQNIAFVGFRLPHGHCIAWTTRGALRRFFRLWSWSALTDALAAVWRERCSAHRLAPALAQPFAPVLPRCLRRDEIERFNVLGVALHAMDSAHRRRGRVGSTARTAQGLLLRHRRARRQRGANDPAFRAILNGAFLNTTDGMPLVWLGRRAQGRWVDRVYGPDLMLEIFRATQQTAFRHFFYGGAPVWPRS